MLQVWYCAQRGLKPWLQPDAENTLTNEQGGHTIWQDEQALLKVGAGAAWLGGWLWSWDTGAGCCASTWSMYS